MLQRRKKLIEVALPLEAINREAAREKSIRHGHPSTLHLWWARRPLAACRAVLFAQLVDDPSSDPQYRIGQRVDEERASGKRADLFDLIEDLVKWQNSNNPDIINKARAEIARCVASRKIELGDLTQSTVIFGSDEGQEHPNGPISTAGVTAYEMVLMRCTPEVVNHFLATYAPPVLDPFAGGGSIPLEAQRLGLRAHASDLNPVPVLINKALIEIPPKFAGQPPINPAWQHKHQSEKTLSSTSWPGARGLAEDVRYYGEWMRNEAEKRIGHLYPKVKIINLRRRKRPLRGTLHPEKRWSKRSGTGSAVPLSPIHPPNRPPERPQSARTATRTPPVRPECAHNTPRGHPPVSGSLRDEWHAQGPALARDRSSGEGKYLLLGYGNAQPSWYDERMTRIMYGERMTRIIVDENGRARFENQEEREEREGARQVWEGGTWRTASPAKVPDRGWVEYELLRVKARGCYAFYRSREIIRLSMRMAKVRKWRPARVVGKRS